MACGQATPRLRFRRFFPESLHLKDLIALDSPKSLARFDPAVFGLRRARRSSDGHSPRRLRTHEGCQIHDVAHEGAFLKDEVIRRKNRHNRFRVLRMNPMCRKQDSGSRSAILRLRKNALSGCLREFLSQNTRRARGTQKSRSATEVVAVLGVQRVAQQRLGPDNLHKLLRTFIATELPDKRPQPDSFASRQHDRPRHDRRRSVRLSKTLSFRVACACIIFESFKTSELSLRSRLQYSLSPSSRRPTVS
jgi:hypothetical protein